MAFFLYLVMRNVVALSVFFTSICNLYSQKIVPIPDRNYWDVSYSYQLHFPHGDKYLSKNKLLNNDSFEVVYSSVLKDRIKTDKSENAAKGNDFNFFDLNSRLSKLKELYPLSNNISLDYYHGDNEDFKRFLTCLFNFYYYDDISIKKSFYISALGYFGKIPSKSNYYAIGFPIKEIARGEMIYLTGSNDPLPDSRIVDSVAKSLFSKVKRTTQEQTDFYESMGDYWRAIEKDPVTAMQYYRIAHRIAGTYRLKSYYAYIQWERLNDKGFWNTRPNNLMGNSFSNVALIAMNNVDFHTAEEFVSHHLVLKAIYFYGTEQMDSFNIYLSKIFGRINTRDSKWFTSDLYHLSSIFETGFKDKDNLSRFNFGDDLIDLVCLNEFTRTKGIKLIFLKYFAYLIAINKRDDVYVVNSFIDNLQRIKLSNGHSFLYNVNSALLYSDIRPDSSDIIFNYLENEISFATEFEQLYLFGILFRHAEIKGDLKSYLEYKKRIEEIKGDNSQAYGQYKWNITLADNQSYSTMLLDSISLIKLLKQSSDALAIKNDSLANAKTLYAQTQENEKKLLISLRLADSTKNAQILDVQTKANHKLWSVIIGLIITGGVSVILSVLLFFSYRSRNKQKEKARAFEVMQEFSKREVEKSKLEIETLRTIFFSHSFWSAFGQIPKKLRLAKLKNDEQKTEIALQVSEGLGRIFYEAVRADGVTSNLMDEIMLCKGYIETMNLAFSKDVQFKLTGSSEIMHSIPFPRLILVHFFVNAFEHGKIGNVKAGYIQIEFRSTSNRTEYELVIQDNGVGMENKIESVSRGGFKAIEIGLSSFNLIQKKVECIFNAETDVYSFFTAGYQLGGVTVIVKIKINENLY